MHSIYSMVFVRTCSSLRWCQCQMWSPLHSARICLCFAQRRHVCLCPAQHRPFQSSLYLVHPNHDGFPHDDSASALLSQPDYLSMRRLRHILPPIPRPTGLMFMARTSTSTHSQRIVHLLAMSVSLSTSTPTSTTMTESTVTLALTVTEMRLLSSSTMPRTGCPITWCTAAATDGTYDACWSS